MRQLACNLSFLCFLIVVPTAAQESPSGKSLAATLEIYAFPKEGQSTEQQSKDEATCYDWAVDNTGSDPFDVQKEGEEEEAQAAAQSEAVQRSTQGAGAKGAVRGAAAGAVVGEIADDDASEGAAVGAAVGLVASRRAARRESEQAQQQIEQQSTTQQTATAEEIGNFKKAFSACLEGKDYMVKY